MSEHIPNISESDDKLPQQEQLEKPVKRKRSQREVTGIISSERARAELIKMDLEEQREYDLVPDDSDTWCVHGYLLSECNDCGDF